MVPRQVSDQVSRNYLPPGVRGALVNVLENWINTLGLNAIGTELLINIALGALNISDGTGPLADLCIPPPSAQYDPNVRHGMSGYDPSQQSFNDMRPSALACHAYNPNDIPPINCVGGHCFDP